ncbi:MAG: hypothetical protein ACYCWW_09220, partial [Deltaproteobacteria bacterium]
RPPVAAKVSAFAVGSHLTPASLETVGEFAFAAGHEAPLRASTLKGDLRRGGRLVAVADVEDLQALVGEGHDVVLDGERTLDEPLRSLSQCLPGDVLVS